MILHPSAHTRIERDIRCIGRLPPPAKFCLLVAATLMVAICSSPIVSASPVQPDSADPLVDVVVDATPPNCALELTRNAASSSSDTTRIPCAPYTLAKSVTMTRTEAVMKGLQYVLRSDQSASASVWQQETDALSQIASNNRSAHASQVQPLSCSWGGSWSQLEGWPTINSDNLDLSISWYTTTDCTGVYLQTAVVREITAVNALYLAEQSYSASCCPYPTWITNMFVGTNTLVHHLPGNTLKYGNGGDFEDAFSNSSWGGIYWWYDLGPLY